MLDRLLRDHAIMREKAEVLLQLLERDAMPSRELIAETRWQLSSHIMQHLAFEDRHLYSKLLRDQREHVREIGRRFHSELAALFTTYSQNAQFWTPEQIANDWDGFRVVSRKMIYAMFARIDLEEAELYPLASDAQIDIASNAAPAINWAREAFVIKDAITVQPRQPVG